MNVTKNQPDALNYQVTIQIEASDYAEPLKKRLNQYRACTETRPSTRA